MMKWNEKKSRISQSAQWCQAPSHHLGHICLVYVRLDWFRVRVRLG